MPAAQRSVRAIGAANMSAKTAEPGAGHAWRGRGRGSVRHGAMPAAQRPDRTTAVVGTNTLLPFTDRYSHYLSIGPYLDDSYTM